MSESTCRNCAAKLYGPYCSACGQHNHGSIQPLWALLHDAWHDLTHLDGRILSTLRLLLTKPGYLSREYLAGRRARYAPPFRLYLVISLVFFSVQAVRSHSSELDVVKTRETTENCQFHSPSPGFERLVRGTCQKLAADGGAAAKHAFDSNFPRMMFVFLPLVAAVMLMMYRRPRRYFIEHLVLVLHNHAAMFVMLLGGSLMSALEGWLPAAATVLGTAQFLLAAYALFYIYRAMRVVYDQSRRLTIAKMLILGFTYSVFLAITSLATFVVGVALA